MLGISQETLTCPQLALSVRDGGLSNTRYDLDQAHSNDVGVLLATLTYYSNSKQIDVEEDKTRRMKEILRGSEESGLGVGCR